MRQMVFLKKFFIPDCWGLRVQKSFFYLCPFLQNGFRIFLYFCMDVEDSRAHRLSQMCFLKKILIPDYRGLNVQKSVVFFTCLAFCSNMALRIFLIFGMSVEDNRAHCLSEMAFQEKFLILDCRGLRVQKRCVFF